MKYSEMFEIITNKEGKELYSIKDGADPFLYNLIVAIHVVDFYEARPNEWIYDTIGEAFLDLEECSSDSDFESVKNGLKYNRRYKEMDWGDLYIGTPIRLAIHSWFQQYIDAARNQMEKGADWEDQFLVGYSLAKQKIYDRVWRFLKEPPNESSCIFSGSPFSFPES